MNNGNVIYLAARYSRRAELCRYRDELEARGFLVPARWLNGGHQIADNGMPLTEEGERKFEEGHPDADHLRARFAADDLSDVLTAGTVIAFTEEPRSGNSRGGRHVEMGIAIGALLTGPAASRRIIVCGPRENLFCWLPFIEHHKTWRDVRDMIDAELAGALGVLP